MYGIFDFAAAMWRPLLLECPDVIVGTPSRILGHVHAGNVNLKSTVEMVVIDEADLLFSFGYEQDMRSLLTWVIVIGFITYFLRSFDHFFTWKLKKGKKKGKGGVLDIALFTWVKLKNRSALQYPKWRTDRQWH